jgi:hypothetical protein
MDGIKIPNLKTTWPEINSHSESNSQVSITAETYFEKADITAAFEKSGIIEDTKRSNERTGVEDHTDELGIREEALIDFISDFEKELKKRLESALDIKFRALDSMPGYVACEVEVSLHGDDSKNMNGSFSTKISIDMEMAEISGILDAVFESMR